MKEEIERLAVLRGQYAEKSAEVVRLKSACQRISQEIGQVRVAHLLDPDNNKPKDTEARLRRLEGEFKAAEAGLPDLVLECQTLAGAIERMESDILPKQHAAKLGHQAEVRNKYKAVCLRLVESANALAAASEAARAIYEEARELYPADALMDSQAPILRFAGLSPVWDALWVSDGTNSTQRENVIGLVWDHDRSLVAAGDLVAIRKLHFENYCKQRNAEAEAERARWRTPVPFVPTAARPRSLSERLSGAYVDESKASVVVRS